MQLTNEHNLPRTIVNAVKNDQYVRGNADWTASELPAAAQIKALMRLHAHEIEEDVIDNVWRLHGDSLHHVLERAAEMDPFAVAEDRFTAALYDVELADGVHDKQTVSGKVDLIEVYGTKEGNIVELSDYKDTSVFGLIFTEKDRGTPIKEEWEAQLNILRWLVEQNSDVKIDRLSVVARGRDWRASEMAKNADYPPVPITKIPADMWPLEETEQYIRDRMLIHSQARLNGDVECTDEERWARGGGYAVMVKGLKNAKRVLSSEDEAHDWAEENLSDKHFEKYYVEYRRPQYKRCEEFCPVSKWCPQWQAEQEAS